MWQAWSMVEQMEKLCGNISLTEGDKAGIAIIEGEIEEARAQAGCCLIGRLWMGKKVKKKLLRQCCQEFGVRRGVWSSRSWKIIFGFSSLKMWMTWGEGWKKGHSLLIAIFSSLMNLMEAQLCHNQALSFLGVNTWHVVTKGIDTNIGESMGAIRGC